MNTLLYAISFSLLGYLFGSIPSAVWITRLVKGVDVREAGSGHATTTNTIRQAGFAWGAVVFIMDIAKGFLPIWLAAHYAPVAWIIPLTAALAVVGHCWPLFAQFRGGMGLATLGGALLSIQWIAFFIGLGLLILLVLTVKHGARASVATGVLVAPLLWLVGLRGDVLWVAATGGLVIAFRFLIDWNRQYRELWLDREKKA